MKHINSFLPRSFPSPIIRVAHLLQVLCQAVHRPTFQGHYLECRDLATKGTKNGLQKENTDNSDK